MNIAIVFSPDWTRYVAIEAFAIFKTNPASIKIYLISDGPAQMDFSRFCRPGYEIQYIDLEQKFKERIPSAVNVCARFTKYALYSLLLPEIIPDDRLLYLDADAIVNGDITDFYNMDMRGDLIAGVADTGMGCGSLETWHEHLRSIGLQPDSHYINTGAVLFNLAGIRKMGLPTKWIQMVNSRGYACPDQDIINLTCQDRIRLIDLKYNVSLSTGLDEYDIRIMHYAGKKPWDTPAVPNYEIWQRWDREYEGRCR